jgi:hypothetical protein
MTIESPSLRVLVAVHGFEPAGWAGEACRLVSRWDGACVRLLAVLDVPRPPFTSLTGPARAAYAGARARWTEIERLRLQPSIDGLVAALPFHAEVVYVAGHDDLAHVIDGASRAWPADIVVVGPATRRRAWTRPGALCARLVARTRCTVVVVTPPAAAGPDRRAPVVALRPARAGHGG